MASVQETSTQYTWEPRALKQALVRHREFMKTFACDEQLQSSSQILNPLSVKKVCTGEDEGDELRKVFSARARRTEHNRRALQSAECLDDCEPVCLDACDDDQASSAPTTYHGRSDEPNSCRASRGSGWDEGAASSEKAGGSREEGVASVGGGRFSTPSSRNPSLGTGAASLRGVKSLMDLPRYVKSVQTCYSMPDSPTVGNSPRAIPDTPSNMLLAFESVEDWGRSAGVPPPERARYGAGFHPLSATHTALRTTCDVLDLQLESRPAAPGDGVSIGGAPRRPRG
ncbi:hypothetical protein T484DRAFT_1942072 [Baffinella frigidus]|nr:hypothetical protein T484DRAFT_1942072 [Cryptophyta sp. CCMP2293]